MRLVFRPIVGQDFAEGFECIRDRFLYDDSTRPALLSMWSDLLSRQAAVGACIEDLDRSFGRAIVWFGVYVFARPEFEDEIEKGLHPYLSARILDLWRKSELPLLDLTEIAAANVRGGMCLVKLHSGMPREMFCNPAAAPILDQNEMFFHYAAAGYRLRSILAEVYGKFERALAREMRYIERSNTAAGLAARNLCPPDHQHPYVYGIDSKEAVHMRGTTIASLFTYKPPMLNLSGIEQEQLFYALGGNTDHELSAILNISYATVRKRWDSVYGKVATCVPHIFIEGYTPELLSGRGCEKRRRVLRYIQFHREELRPYEH